MERYLKKHWQPFQGLPISEIRQALVATRLEEIAEQSGPIATNRARAAQSAPFAWAVAVGLAESNPVIGTIRVASEVSRERIRRKLFVSQFQILCRKSYWRRAACSRAGILIAP